MRPEAEQSVRPSHIYVALVSKQAAARRMSPMRARICSVLGTIVLVSAFLLGCGSDLLTPQARRDKFSNQVLKNMDLDAVITWARGHLSLTNATGLILPRSSFPKSLETAHPLLVQVVADTQTGSRFVFIAFKISVEREGLMIGMPNAKVNNYGYRHPITNGVFYVLDRDSSGRL